MKKKALIVVTSHNQLGRTEKKTGWHLSEVSHVYWELYRAGFEVVFASPKGGEASLDPESLKFDDPENKSFVEKFSSDISMSTEKLEDIKSDGFMVIYFAGGHGSMWDFPENEEISRLVNEIYDTGGIVSAICHGTSALCDVKTSSGEYLIKEKKINSFTDAEEREAQLSDVVPFLLETRLKQRGALFESADNFKEKVVSDQRLITGQNPASAKALGRKIVSESNRIEFSNEKNDRYDGDSLHWVVQT